MKFLILAILLIAVSVEAGKGKGGTSGGGNVPFRLGLSNLAGPGRSGIAAVSHNNFEIYAIGGTVSQNSALNDVDKFSLFNNTWRAVSPLNIDRNAPGGASLDGFVYVYGGIGDNLVPLTSMEAYNTESDTWTNLAANLLRPRWNLGAVNLCRNLYAIGGYDIVDRNATTIFIASVTNAETWSRENPVWTNINPLPAPRAAFAIVTLNNEIWVIGGTTNFLTGTAQQPLATSTIWSPVTGLWRDGPSLTQTRVGFGATVIDNKIIIAGGRTEAGDLLAEIEFYDPLQNGLGFQEASFTPRTLRFNNAVTSIGNVLFLLGGRVSNGDAFSFTRRVEPITIIS
jgi:hypothetical protein